MKIRLSLSRVQGYEYFRDTDPMSARDLLHEEIHIKQMIETLFVGFYILYVLEWLVRLIQFGNPKVAYRNISFEVEAYTYESDPGYLDIRVAYSWWDFLWQCG